MKHSKSLFKYALRHCRRREDQLRADSLAKDLSLKRYKEFWNGVKAQRASKISNPSTVGGCAGDSNVLAMWSDHYKVIFSSTLHDDAALDALREALDSVPANSCDFLESYEVVKSITKLNRGKSMDLNGLSPEHIIYASESIAEPLALLFTSMLIHGYMPKEMIKSMIVPIIKSKTRSITDKSNYRPVAISTVMSKLFELLLLDRLEPYLTTMDNQFGFKKHHGTELCVFTLMEALCFYHSEGTPMFLCFLDASAAFDRISFEILFNKLIKRDVPLYLIRILYFWYFNQQICVRWNSLLSDFFPVTNGVRQGGILSSFLVNVYMDDLSKSLNKLSVGCYIKGQVLNHLMYADDNVLLAPSLKGLQKLLNITYSYGTAHGILFNKLKTVCMRIKGKGKYWLKENLSIILGNHELNFVNEYCYLGHVICNDLSDDVDIKRQLRSLYCRANSLKFKFQHCSDVVKSLLFKMFCSTIYCSSLWCKYTKTVYQKVKVAYNNACRIIMSLPKHCSASNMFVSRTINTFEGLVRNQQLSLKNRVYESNNKYLQAIVQSDIVYKSDLFRQIEQSLYTVYM